MDNNFEKLKKAKSVAETLSAFESIAKESRIDLQYYYSTKNTSTSDGKLQRQRFYELIPETQKGGELKQLCELFEKRFTDKDLSDRSKDLNDLKILIIGAGPVGLRSSIDLALLGFKVVVVEKRDSFTRNNVVQLINSTIADLNKIGQEFFTNHFKESKKNHISLKKLQLFLLKSALLVGVEIHFKTEFKDLIKPTDTTGWRAKFSTEKSGLSDIDFHVVIGADGNNTVLSVSVERDNHEFGFNHRTCNIKNGLSPIGITGNFMKNFSEHEEAIQDFVRLKKEEIPFYLAKPFGIESFIYFNNDTHYFVMSATKECLKDRGVIKKDKRDLLLAKENINRDELSKFIKEVAKIVTGDKLANLKFAEMKDGNDDASIFYFLPLKFAEKPSKIYKREGKNLLMALAGDSLIEPFWQHGTGINYGFFAAFDTVWMIKQFAQNYQKNDSILAGIMNDRMRSYKALLSYILRPNIAYIKSDFKNYSLDPKTRYTYNNEKHPIIQESATEIEESAEIKTSVEQAIEAINMTIEKLIIELNNAEPEMIY